MHSFYGVVGRLFTLIVSFLKINEVRSLSIDRVYNTTVVVSDTMKHLIHCVIQQYFFRFEQQMQSYALYFNI